MIGGEVQGEKGETNGRWGCPRKGGEAQGSWRGLGKSGETYGKRGSPRKADADLGVSHDIEIHEV